MMKRETFAIADIYVPAKRRSTLDLDKAREIAESMLQVGQQTPILVRRDGERYALRPGGRPASAGSLQATGRGNDRRLPRAGATALRSAPAGGSAPGNGSDHALRRDARPPVNSASGT
jgi:hypothetical protein